MTDGATPEQHCSLDRPVDLREALSAAGIEFLDVDVRRTVAIYRQSVLMVSATTGQATAAEAVAVELWETPPGGLQQAPEEFIDTFLEALLTAADATCADTQT